MQNSIPAVNQHHTDFILGDPFVVLADRMQHVENLTGSLDPGVASTDDDESQQPFANFLPVFDIGLFDPGNDCCPENHRVTHITHQQRVLRHTGNTTQVDLRTKTEHEMIVFQNYSGAEAAGIDQHFPLFQIDAFDGPFVNAQAAAQSANRIHHMTRGERSSGDLGQKRLENHVVLIGNNGGTLRIFADFLQRFP